MRPVLDVVVLRFAKMALGYIRSIFIYRITHGIAPLFLIIYVFIYLYTIEGHLSICGGALTCGYFVAARPPYKRQHHPLRTQQEG